MEHSGNDNYEPVRSRPLFPPGYQVPQTEEDMLPWRYAEERLERARNYWICTASPDAEPHARPVWGVWLDGRFYFEGGPTTRWGRNIKANPRVTVHLESGDEAVILHGRVDDVDDVGSELYARIAVIYDAKYNYHPEDHGFFVVQPRVAYGWTTWPRTPTRWRFTEYEGGD